MHVRGCVREWVGAYVGVHVHVCGCVYIVCAWAYTCMRGCVCVRAAVCRTVLSALCLADDTPTGRVKWVTAAGVLYSPPERSPLKDTVHIL